MQKTDSITDLVRYVAQEVYDIENETQELFNNEVRKRITGIENELKEKDMINGKIGGRLADIEDELTEIQDDLKEKDMFIDEDEKRLEELENRIGKGFATEDVKESIKNIKNSLDDISGTWSNHNCGSLWHKHEENTLEKEMKAVITAIAINHGRTEKAIRARLKKMEVLDN